MGSGGTTARTVGITNPRRVAAVRRLGVAERSIEPRFDRIGRLIERALGADHGSVGIIDDTHMYWSTQDAGPTPCWNRADPVESTLSRIIVDTGEPLIIDDLSTRPELGPPAGGSRVRSFIGVPLWDRSGVLIGVVGGVAREYRRWTEHDRDLLERLAQIAIDELESALNERSANQAGGLLVNALRYSDAHFALLDEQLRFVMINDSMAATGGREPSAYTGHHYGEMMPVVAGQLVDRLQHVLDTGISFSNIHVIGPPRSRNGPRVVWSANSYRLMHDGRPHVTLIGADVTENVEMQRRGIELADLTQALSDATSVGEAERIAATRLQRLFRADEIDVALHHGPAPSADGSPASTEIGYREATFLHHRTGVERTRTTEVTVPCLTARQTAVGHITLRWDRGISADDLAERELRMAGRLVAAAVERDALTRQRDELIAELEAAILSPPPVRPGIETFVHHAPAVAAARMGGDWFDVFPISDQVTALVVGDVAGHGPTAAAAMSQIGSTIAQLLIMGTDVADVFTEAERVLAARSAAAMATVGIVLVDVEQCTVTSVSAGHPPPLMIRPDGSAELLASALRPPLCTFDGDVEPVAVPFAAGSRLVMFTDGLVERRTTDLASDLDRLVEFAPTVADLDLDDMVAALVEALSSGADDTVVLAAHLSGVAPQLRELDDPRNDQRSERRDDRMSTTVSP